MLETHKLTHLIDLWLVHVMVSGVLSEYMSALLASTLQERANSYDGISPGSDSMYNNGNEACSLLNGII